MKQRVVRSALGLDSLDPLLGHLGQRRSLKAAWEFNIRPAINHDRQSIRLPLGVALEKYVNSRLGINDHHLSGHGGHLRFALRWVSGIANCNCYSGVGDRRFSKFVARVLSGLWAWNKASENTIAALFSMEAAADFFCLFTVTCCFSVHELCDPTFEIGLSYFNIFFRNMDNSDTGWIMIIVSLKNLSAYYKLEKQAQKLSFQANKRLSKVNSKNLQDLPKYGHERSRYIAGHSQP